jgi:hypothetical protein
MSIRRMQCINLSPTTIKANITNYIWVYKIEIKMEDLKMLREKKMA